MMQPKQSAAGAPVTSPEAWALLQATDWSRHALGPMERWPQSLRIALGICLNSRFPMFVWWGPQLINFYNDAYIPLLGKRHPSAFARPAQAAWEEIWDVVGVQADAVMQRGEASWNERMLLVMERHGFREEAYFTWSYSPIPDDAPDGSGGIGGLFCACTEETPRVLVERERDRLLARAQSERERLADAFTLSPSFMAVTRGPAHVFEFANERYLQLIGGREVVGQTVTVALPEVVEQGFIGILDGVYTSGQPYVGNDMQVLLQRQSGRPLETCYVDFVYLPMRDADGIVTGILAHGIDVTERHQTETRDRFLLALDEAVRPLTDPEEITRTCARLLGEHLQADRCAYADVEADQDTFNVSGNYNRVVPGIVGRYRFFSDFGEQALQLMHAGQPLVVNDVDDHQPALGDLSAYRQTMIQAVICVPLHKSGRFVAAMAVHQATPRHWTAEEVDLTHHVANRCWESMERAHVARELRESEQRFRNMSDQAPVMIWLTRPDRQCEYVNKQWYDFTGQTHAQPLGEGWVDVVHPDDALKTIDTFTAATARREPFSHEFRMRRADGSYRWCVVSAAPRPVARSEVPGYIGSVIDITDRKRIEDGLAAEKKVLELMATGAALPDVLETLVRMVEAQSADGMLCSVLVLDEAGECLHRGAAPSLPEPYNAAIDGLRIGTSAGSCGTAAFEDRVVSVDDISNDPLWQDFRALAAEQGLGACTSIPIRASDGRVLGSVAVYYRQPRETSAHDLDLARLASHLGGIVLEKHSVDQRLRQSLQAEQEARSEAERASRMKDDFLATLSHELRTPLNAILGWVGILRLQQEALPAELAQGVDVIERNARAQAQIIQDLLDMSAIISGKVRLDLQNVDLAEIALAAVETARPNADARHVRLVHSTRDAIGDSTVSGDASRLQQILWNLLSNAIKFTPRGGEVQVRLARAGSLLELTVSDTGEGIDAEFLPYVFDRFRQADASISRRHGGLGLGLSIVKKLVELHGGTVHAHSAGAGCGTTFVVALPLACSQPALRAPSPARGGSHASELDGVNVLVVDDDPDARLMTQRLLEACSARVSTADSAGAAVSALEDGAFDVLVSDIGMPGEDGYALMRRVRALDADRGGAIPAIALTAYAGADDRLKAIRAGYQMHLPKPIEPAELVALIASVARRF
ncbi:MULTISPECIES: ATP-binding protein [Novilysobacter]|uniref:ATP-binding protein n=1 Tax=Novilysobacter TaxID=3382699 RepID=UPI002FC6BB92